MQFINGCRTELIQSFTISATIKKKIQSEFPLSVLIFDQFLVQFYKKMKIIMLSTIYFNHSLNANVRHDIIDMDDSSTYAYLFNIEFNKPA